MAFGSELAFGEQGPAPAAASRAWLGSQYDADGAPLVWTYVRSAACRSKPVGALSSSYHTGAIAQSDALEAFAQRARRYDDEASAQPLAGSAAQDRENCLNYHGGYPGGAGDEYLFGQCLCL